MDSILSDESSVGPLGGLSRSQEWPGHTEPAELEPTTGPVPWPARAEHYSLGTPISQSALASNGSAASVWLATCSDGREAAVRIVDLETQTSRDFGRIASEVQRMASLRHANLCELHAAFVTRGEVWLVMQLHEAGSCADILRLAAPSGLEEPAALAVLREVCKALSYLHSIGLIHRQLKAAAVLVDACARVRLSDLSLAGALLEFGERRRARQTFVGVGQVYWSAPEMLEQAGGYDAAVDLWAIGITAMELATGAPPYLGEPPMKVMLKVLQGEPPVLAAASEPYRDLVAACLVKTPADRMRADALLSLPALANLPPDACQLALLPIVRSLPPLRARRAVTNSAGPRTGMLGLPVRLGSRGSSLRGSRSGSRRGGDRWWEEGGGWDFEDDEAPAADSAAGHGGAGARGGAGGGNGLALAGGMAPLRVERQKSPGSQTSSSPSESPLPRGAAANQKRGGRKRGFVVRHQDAALAAGAELAALQQAVVGLLKQVEGAGPGWGAGAVPPEAEARPEAGGWFEPDASVLRALPLAVQKLAEQNELLRAHNQLLREMRPMVAREVKHMVAASGAQPRAGGSVASSLANSAAGSAADLASGYSSGNLTGLSERSFERSNWSSCQPSQPPSQQLSRRASLEGIEAASPPRPALGSGTGSQQLSRRSSQEANLNGSASLASLAGSKPLSLAGSNLPSQTNSQLGSRERSRSDGDSPVSLAPPSRPPSRGIPSPCPSPEPLL